MSTQRTRRNQPIDIRPRLAAVHGRMVDTIATLGIAINRRLTTPAVRASHISGPRSMDLPEFAARLSAAAMRDVATVAAMLVDSSGKASALHEQSDIDPTFELRLLHLEDDIATAGKAAAAPFDEDNPLERPEFKEVEAAILARLSGLDLDLGDGGKTDTPPPDPFAPRPGKPD